MRPLRDMPLWRGDELDRAAADLVDLVLAAAPRRDFRAAVRDLAVRRDQGFQFRRHASRIVSMSSTLCRCAEESGNAASARAEWWRHYACGAISDAAMMPYRSGDEKRGLLESAIRRGARARLAARGVECAYRLHPAVDDEVAVLCRELGIPPLARFDTAEGAAP